MRYLRGTAFAATFHLLPFLMKSLRFAALTGLLGAALLGASTAPVAAQGTVRRHLVQFRDKIGTPYTVGQPQQFLSARALARRQRQQIPVAARDLPPSPAYLQQVRALGAEVVYQTRWLNGAIVACDSVKLGLIRALPFVRDAQTLNRPGRAGRPARAPRAEVSAARPATANPYGKAFAQAEQIDAVAMHTAGFRGEGIQIAVFDAGFPGVDQIAAFQPLFQQGRLASTFDFVGKDRSVYERDGHGTATLSCIAGNLPNTFIGTAPNATFHLCITEDISSEHPIEEGNWLIAAEYADSAGVDIISSSLGYTTFDSPSPSYTNSSMDGNTALVTRAADLASAVGILVVNSAGNDGNGGWRYIGAPADGDSVLTVGAVDSTGIYARFSSQGPTADGRLKPNLAAQGQAAAIIGGNGFVYRGNGTSFSCPILAGMAAGFWQANQNLTAQQVRQFLEASGSQTNNPDNLLGKGIPNFRRAMIAAGNPLATASPGPDGRGVPELYPNPVPGGAFGLRLPPHLQRVPLTLEISDATGRVLEVEQVTATADTFVVELKGQVLVKGIYFCRLRATSGESHVLRFARD